MAKRAENPRYGVVSVRVTDEELELIKKAKAAGFSQENIRGLLLFGARCVSATPPIPLTQVILAGEQGEVTA